MPHQSTLASLAWTEEEYRLVLDCLSEVEDALIHFGNCLAVSSANLASLLPICIRRLEPAQRGSAHDGKADGFQNLAEDFFCFCSILRLIPGSLFSFDKFGRLGAWDQWAAVSFDFIEKFLAFF